MVKHLINLVLLLGLQQAISAQSIDKVITISEVERIEKYLASDDMKGRYIFTPELDKAAAFIADEFKKAGLQPGNGPSYFQDFSILRKRFVSASGEINGTALGEKNIVGITAKTELSIDKNSGYELVTVAAKDTLESRINQLQAGGKNALVLVDTAQRAAFEALKRARKPFAPKNDLVVILTNLKPESYAVKFKQDAIVNPLKNVVGILPGKSKKEEYVIFSGHYDHIGIRKPNAAGDSIANGANDDASGITAVIMLAKYFTQLNNNERTLVFTAFTAEESGGFGSQYFSQQFNPAQVMAMFNIEMIGTESKWGTNSAFITGYEKTDMGKILEKNLAASKFKFHPDPYPDQQLFYRSDNATLARQGVPAHTISTSKMDSEKFYHTVDDEVETLDLKNMTEIIKSIAVSSVSIVAGKDTPSRVDATQLR